MLRTAKRYLAMNRADRLMARSAFVRLAKIDIALQVLGFRRVVERQSRLATVPLATVRYEDVARARQYAGWIEAVAQRHFLRARCLHRSLALHNWLRQDGLPSELKIGVLKEDGQLRAHAWIEINGAVVNDHPGTVSTFTPLVGLDDGCAVRSGSGSANPNRQAAVTKS